MAVLEKAVPSRQVAAAVCVETRAAGGRVLLAERVLRGLLCPARGLDSRAHVHPSGKDFGHFRVAGAVDERGKIPKRRFRDLPREASYFFGIICMLFISALLSPVWRGGAFFKTLDFSKALVAWVLTLPGDHQLREIAANHFHPVGFGRGDYRGVRSERTVPSPAGRCDWRNLFQSQ